MAPQDPTSPVWGASMLAPCVVVAVVAAVAVGREDETWQVLGFMLSRVPFMHIQGHTLSACSVPRGCCLRHMVGSSHPPHWPGIEELIAPTLLGVLCCAGVMMKAEHAETASSI